MTHPQGGVTLDRTGPTRAGEATNIIGWEGDEVYRRRF